MVVVLSGGMVVAVSGGMQAMLCNQHGGLYWALLGPCHVQPSCPCLEAYLGIGGT